jgi:hypothetical protein
VCWFLLCLLGLESAHGGGQHTGQSQREEKADTETAEKRHWERRGKEEEKGEGRKNNGGWERSQR